MGIAGFGDGAGDDVAAFLEVGGEGDGVGGGGFEGVGVEEVSVFSVEQLAG